MCNPMGLHSGFPALASASSALQLLLPLALVFVPHTTLSGLFVFWSKHCDFSEVFGSVCSRWDGSFLLPRGVAEHWTVCG